jgi:hypothetical protein
MGPGDLFVGIRQFFGYFIPGVIWLSAALLSFGLRPDHVDRWPLIVAFILAGYVIGFTIHGLLFRRIVAVENRLAKRRDLKKRKSARAEPSVATYANNAAAAMVRLLAAEQPREVHSYLSALSEEELGEFCKRYVAVRSTYLAEEFRELEGTINFITGVAPAVLGLAVGFGLYPAWHHVAETWKFAAAAVACAGVSVLLFMRLSWRLLGERHHWHRGMVIVVLQESHRSGDAAA